MFGETGWDVLLALYSKGAESRQSLARVADLIGAAPSTVARWVALLEERNFIQREPNPIDKRTVFLSLTDRARALLEQYFSETL